MRRGVVAHGGPAIRRGYFGAQLVADFDGLEGFDFVNREARNARISVFDHRNALAGVCVIERAAIADLSASLGVKRSLIEDKLSFDAGLQFAHRLLVDEKAKDLRSRVEAIVAEEFRSSTFGQELLIGGNYRALLGAFPTGASALALDTHLVFESVAIDPDAALAGDVFLFVEGKAEGVVKLERHG